MSSTTYPKTRPNINTNGCEATSSTCSFEGRLVGIAANRLEMESGSRKTSSYALASDAMLKCDGKESHKDLLKSGRRIRVTTQKSNANTVTGIEVLNEINSMPAAKANFAI
ncbi:MAG: hypothetical protein WAO83_20080 [Fuerstiella sp.]|mgnify:CR=1 FL=1